MSATILQFKPRPPRNSGKETSPLFWEIQKTAIDVLCVGSAVLLVSTAAVGITGIFFVFGCLLTFE